MRKEILKQLDDIEREHRVTILFACESGSRAWGFPSADSDYDVRFVYSHGLDWYLSIASGRDVIEIPVDPVLDINGWDVRKALQLLRKSNIALLEWASSPIRYACHEELFNIFREAIPHGFQKHASAKHYLSMAKSSMEKTGGQTVRAKSYLYVLRALLCCRWVLERNQQPPMLFGDLAAEFLVGTDVGQEAAALIEAKKTQSERDRVDKSDVFNDFISSEFQRLSSLLPKAEMLPDIAPFDSVFRQIIAKV